MKPQQPVVRSLQGVTISAPDPRDAADSLAKALGWVVHSKSPITAAVEERWGVGAGSAGPSATVVGPPDADRGLVRIVTGPGLDDLGSDVLPGRWMGIEMVISEDTDELARRLDASTSFRMLHPPVNMDWSDVASNVHRSTVFLGPGNVRLAFTRPVTQPEGRTFHEALGPVGQVFSVQLCTSDRDAVSGFYRDDLGMIPLIEKALPSGSFWHEFLDFDGDEFAALDLYKGDAPGSGRGGVEVQSYERHRVWRSPREVEGFDPGVGLVTFTAPDIGRAIEVVGSSERAEVIWSDDDGATVLGPDRERIELVPEDTRWGAS